jgi:hypothetical protein
MGRESGAAESDRAGSVPNTHQFCREIALSRAAGFRTKRCPGSDRRDRGCHGRDARPSPPPRWSRAPSLVSVPTIRPDRSTRPFGRGPAGTTPWPRPVPQQTADQPNPSMMADTPTSVSVIATLPRQAAVQRVGPLRPFVEQCPPRTSRTAIYMDSVIGQVRVAVHHAAVGTRPGERPSRWRDRLATASPPHRASARRSPASSW